MKKAETETSRLTHTERNPALHFITCDMLHLLVGNLVTTIYPLVMQE